MFNLFSRPDGSGVSNTKAGGFLAGLAAILTIWGVEIDPRWLETAKWLGGVWAIFGARDAVAKK